MRNATVVVAVLVVVAMVATTAQADIYEPFDYDSATALGPDVSGTTESGFATDSTWNGIMGKNPVALSNDDTSLAYPDGVTFTPTGSRVKDGTGFYHKSGREMATAINLGATDTFYMSALFNRADDDDSTFCIWFAEDSTGEGYKIGFGISGSDQFFAAISGNVAKPSTAVVAGDTYFLVVKVETFASGNDKAYLKIYDKNATVGTEPTTWDIIAEGDGSGAATYLCPTVCGGSGDGDQIDEFRMGGSWQNVTSVPEPATMVLLGLGGISVLIRRRRR